MASGKGFRHLTTHALVELMSEITNSLNKRKHSIGVFIDLRKAFDTVDHQLLCKKLEFYGIRGIALLKVISQKERSMFILVNMNLNV